MSKNDWPNVKKGNRILITKISKILPPFCLDFLFFNFKLIYFQFEKGLLVKSKP